MAKLKFQIVTPERTVLHEEVDSLSCPTQNGQITILPNHIPLISALQSGELTARMGDRNEHIAVSGGFVEVRPGNQIIVLADSAERADEIDPTRAEDARKAAEEAMKGEVSRSSEEFATIAAALQKNLVRLKVSKRSTRTHKHHNQIDVNENNNN